MSSLFDSKAEPAGLSGPIAISGYLHKRKQTQRMLQPVWNRRFFALDGRLLKYFSSKRSTKPSAVIDILDIESIRSLDMESCGQHSFILSTKARGYYLRAESEGKMKHWVRGLQDQKAMWSAKLNKSPSARKPKHYSDTAMTGSIFAPILSPTSIEKTEEDDSDGEFDESEAAVNSNTALSPTSNKWNGWTDDSQGNHLDYIDTSDETDCIQHTVVTEVQQ